MRECAKKLTFTTIGLQRSRRDSFPPIRLPLLVPDWPAPCYWAYCKHMKIRLNFFALNLVLFALLPAALAQDTVYGTAWELSGTWHVNRAANGLQAGDLLPQGALLSADPARESHAVVLLAGGQRLFFDCHDAASCGQGFRLPPAGGASSAEEARVFRAACVVRREKLSSFPVKVSPGVARVEAVAPLGKDNTVDLTEALRALPPGSYRVAIDEESSGKQISDREVHRGGAAGRLVVSVPGPGLYELRLYGGLQTERMRAYVLVAAPSSFEAAQQDFHAASEVVEEWHERSMGWPVDDFLFSYLMYLSRGPRS